MAPTSGLPPLPPGYSFAYGEDDNSSKPNDLPPLPAGYSFADEPPASQSVPSGTPGGAPEPVLPQPHPTAGLSANTMTPVQRLRNVFANSALGRSLQSTMPKVASALDLTPSESIGSPTYAEHANEPLALDEMIPTPQTAVGRVARGALRGTSQALSAPALATTAAIAATGGLVAPLAADAGIAGAAGRLGRNALKYGLVGQGAKGLYQAAKNAYQQYSGGDTAGAEESAGEMIPNAAMTLLGTDEPIEKTGEGMQNASEGIIRRTLGINKSDIRRDANPARAYFDENHGPSLSMSSIADKADRDLEDLGPALRDSYKRATSAGVSIPAADVIDVLNSTVGNAVADANREGGTGDSGRLEKFLGTFHTTFAKAQNGGSLTPEELWEIRKRIDRHTSWRDATQQDVTAIRQQTSGALGGLLESAVPGTADLNERYRNTLILRNRAAERAQTGSSPAGHIARSAMMGGIGSMLGLEAHGVPAAVTAGLTGLALDSVPARTSLASGLQYGGRLAGAAGRGISRLTEPLTLGNRTFDGEPYSVGNPDENNSNTNAFQNPFQNPQGAPPRGSQYTPLRLPAPGQGQTAPEAAATPQSLRERLLQNYRLRQQQSAQYRPYREPVEAPAAPIPARGTITVSPEGAAVRGSAGELPEPAPVPQLPAPGRPPIITPPPAPPPEPPIAQPAASILVRDPATGQMTRQYLTSTAAPGAKATIPEPANVARPSEVPQAPPRVLNGQIVPPEGYSPETHTFSGKAWKAANPKGNVGAARAKAVKMGYEVVD